MIDPKVQKVLDDAKAIIQKAIDDSYIENIKEYMDEYIIKMVEANNGKAHIASSEIVDDVYHCDLVYVPPVNWIKADVKIIH